MLTCGASLVFLYVYIQTNFVMPVDLVLLPWLIWISTKMLYTVKKFKNGVISINQKYDKKINEINLEIRNQVDF